MAKQHTAGALQKAAAHLPSQPVTVVFQALKEMGTWPSRVRHNKQMLDSYTIPCFRPRMGGQLQGWFNRNFQGVKK